MNAGPIMIMAGGTGGHIFPGLAVAAALRARGAQVTWLGSDGGMETRLVPQHGIAIDTIAIKGLRGKGIATLFAAPLRVLAAVRAAARVLRARRPGAVISFGGYASGPGGIAARLGGLPLFVHEQNRAAGLTNRVLARFAGKVLTGFPGTFAAEDVVGNPVRAEVAAIAPPAQRLGGRSGPLRVLVMGGSQGAHALNVVFPQAMGRLKDVPMEVRHQCGERHIDRTANIYAASKLQVTPEGFIADMAQAYAWADVVVCRAGASTIAELCAVGLGAVLIPFPQAVDDHQTRNAQYLSERGAAVLLAEGEDFERRLAGAVRALAADPARRLAMAEAARTLAMPDAAARIADLLLERTLPERAA